MGALHLDIGAGTPLVKLASVTLTEEKTQVDIDLTELDWSQYAAVKLYMMPVCAGGSNVCLLVNGVASGYSQSYVAGVSFSWSGLLEANGDHSLSEIILMRKPDGLVGTGTTVNRGGNSSTGFGCAYTGLAASDGVTLNIVRKEGTYGLGVGTWIAVYGIKK